MRILLIGHGYVGSYLKPRLQAAGLPVTVCDENSSRLSPSDDSFHGRYQSLTKETLAPYDVILWFAGHSSVPMSVADPEGALSNNCFDLLQLALNKRTDARLFYASSASVYSAPIGETSDTVGPLNESQTRLNPTNPYDATKLAFDALSVCFAKNTVGLRLGTVCGYSPFLRPELVFNAMNISALRNGEIKLANGRAYRALLFLDDLAYYLIRMINFQNDLPRIINLASYNVKFEDLARQISDFHHVRVVKLGDSPTYSFQVDWRLARGLFGARREISIHQRCADFIKDLEVNGKA
jgi:nucleoside-diphosphate-sugar epimerase